MAREWVRKMSTIVLVALVNLNSRVHMNIPFFRAYDVNHYELVVADAGELPGYKNIDMMTNSSRCRMIQQFASFLFYFPFVRDWRRNYQPSRWDEGEDTVNTDTYSEMPSERKSPTIAKSAVKFLRWRIFQTQKEEIRRRWFVHFGVAWNTR